MTHPHPLDPLTADEICRVTALLRRERGVARPQWRIAAIELREPAKEVVRGHRPGDLVERVARAIVWDTRDGLAYVAVLSVSDDAIGWESLYSAAAQCFLGSSLRDTPDGRHRLAR